MRFSVTRRHRPDRVVTLSPTGEVDLRTAKALRTAILDTLHTPYPVDVVVDLARVTFLDCAGIGALMAGRNTAVRRGCGYTVVNPQRNVRQVLEITGVQAFTVRPVRQIGQPVRSPLLSRARSRADVGREQVNPGVATV